LYAHLACSDVLETIFYPELRNGLRSAPAGPDNNDSEEARWFLGRLQGLRTFLLSHPVERSYTYDADDRVIRRLTQMGNFKEDESKTYNFKEDERKTYNEQGDEDWTLMIRSRIDDDERSEFRYLYQYDRHGNWTERTKINTDQPDNPNTQRRTLAYY
jgi:hypothetical protein